MSAMEKMLSDILKSVIPPEVMEMLTAENIEMFALKMQSYLEAHADFQNEAIDILRRLDNVYSNNADGRNAAE